MGELTNTKMPTRVSAARNQNLVQRPKIAAKLMEAFLPSDIKSSIGILDSGDKRRNYGFY